MIKSRPAVSLAVETSKKNAKLSLAVRSGVRAGVTASDDWEARV
jgi:hypothetical protein